jgi:hypothetical protein
MLNCLKKTVVDPSQKIGYYVLECKPSLQTLCYDPDGQVIILLLITGKKL